MPIYRSKTTTAGRNMAGARALWRATGMKDDDFSKPIIAVVKKQGAELSREELLKFYEGKTAKWQIPDDVVFVDAIPIGATGKMLKTRLREQLKDYKLPA